MGDELTTQDKIFVKTLVKTGNKTKSAKKAYGYKNDNTAGVMALDKLRKPKIQKAIKTIADALPDEDLIKVHKEGLQAITGKGDDTQPDYSVRHKYLDSAYKLKGTYAPDKSVNVNLNLDDGLTDEEKEGLRKLLKK